MKKLTTALCAAGLFISCASQAEDIWVTHQQKQWEREQIRKEIEAENTKKKKEKQEEKLRLAQLREAQSRDVANTIEAVYFGIKGIVNTVLFLEQMPPVVNRIGYMCVGAAGVLTTQWLLALSHAEND